MAHRTDRGPVHRPPARGRTGPRCGHDVFRQRNPGAPAAQVASPVPVRGLLHGTREGVLPRGRFRRDHHPGSPRHQSGRHRACRRRRLRCRLLGARAALRQGRPGRRACLDLPALAARLVRAARRRHRHRARPRRPQGGAGALGNRDLRLSAAGEGAGRPTAARAARLQRRHPAAGARRRARGLRDRRDLLPAAIGGAIPPVHATFQRRGLLRRHAVHHPRHGHPAPGTGRGIPRGEPARLGVRAGASGRDRRAHSRELCPRPAVGEAALRGRAHDAARALGSRGAGPHARRPLAAHLRRLPRTRPRAAGCRRRCQRTALSTPAADGTGAGCCGCLRSASSSWPWSRGSRVASITSIRACGSSWRRTGACRTNCMR